MNKTAQFTPGPWVAIKGDTFNRERPWGVSKYLSRKAHIEIDGTDEDYPTRTEVIAELTETQDPREVEHTAYLIAAAPTMKKELEVVREFLLCLYEAGNNEAGQYAASIDTTINEAEGR